ncbi:[acyl-carrier-protein] S-malonyltransferase [Amphibacillus marinus]|uniref:Malonyl CoA-acyl carrier protein transacylase n=1 Tax=Amphibacillus marinus TaxID=872970 RepID=A0A1H8HWR5_9BACI|nr:ACP S-malonyltransferase [Amphibacillus marinus]SEN60497.1 [acyl-carrier-protein] S-malonyltransferase [Amphibacillus marinus]
MGKRVAFVFPGQGSQKVGMGQELFSQNQKAKAALVNADESLGFSISTLIAEGPELALTETKHAQPALLLMSSILADMLSEAGVKPVVTAGHSLGEYSALVASGVLAFEDALKLVHERGKLMEAAYPANQGSMAAVLGLEAPTIKDTISGLEETVELANLNCPGQIVISGTKQGIEVAIPLLQEAGAKRVIPLNVSGPFHSSLMKPASEQFAQLLDKITFHDAAIPVFANVTAEKVEGAAEIKELLVKQLYSPVRFHEIISALLADELDAIIEVGNGKVLSGLIKKVSRRAKVFSVEDLVSLEACVNWYKEEESNGE